MKMALTEEEAGLLERLDSGSLNGVVGNCWTEGGFSCWRAIENGVPREYRQGPSGRFFNGKDYEMYAGPLYLCREWKTDRERLAFLRKYGRLFSALDVRAYSAASGSPVRREA